MLVNLLEIQGSNKQMKEIYDKGVAYVESYTGENVIDTIDSEPILSDAFKELYPYVELENVYDEGDLDEITIIREVLAKVYDDLHFMEITICEDCRFEVCIYKINPKLRDYQSVRGILTRVFGYKNHEQPFQVVDIYDYERMFGLWNKYTVKIKVEGGRMEVLDLYTDDIVNIGNHIKYIDHKGTIIGKVNGIHKK